MKGGVVSDELARGGVELGTNLDTEVELPEQVV